MEGSKRLSFVAICLAAFCTQALAQEEFPGVPVPTEEEVDAYLREQWRLKSLEPPPMVVEATYADPHIEESLRWQEYEDVKAQYGKAFADDMFYGNCESAFFQPADLVFFGPLLAKAASRAVAGIAARRLVGRAMVDVSTSHGVTQEFLLKTFRKLGVHPKYIRAFERNFKGFLSAEEWDARGLPLMSVAGTLPETGEIVLRREAIFFFGQDEKVVRNVIRAALEESVHAQRIQSGLFDMANIMREEARAKLYLNRIMQGGDAGRAEILKELEQYPKVHAGEPGYDKMVAAIRK